MHTPTRGAGRSMLAALVLGKSFRSGDDGPGTSVPADLTPSHRAARSHDHQSPSGTVRTDCTAEDSRRRSQPLRAPGRTRRRAR